MCAAPRSPGKALDAPARLEALARSRIAETTGHPGLRHLARLAALSLDAEAAVISTVGERNVVVLATHVADADRCPEGAVLPAGVFSWVVHAEGDVRVVDVVSNLRARREQVDLGAFAACLVAPIRWSGEVVGALAILSHGPRAWTDEDAALADEFGAVASEIVRVEGGRVQAIEARHDALEHERSVLRYVLGVEKMLDALPFAVAVCDRSLDVVQANLAFARIVGRSLDDVIGVALGSMLPRMLVARCRGVLKTGEALSDVPARIGDRDHLVAVFPVARIGQTVGRLGLMLA